MFFSPNNSFHITFHRPRGNSHGQQQRPFPSLIPNTNDFLKFPLIWWVLDQPLVGFIGPFPSTRWSPVSWDFLPFEFFFSEWHFLHQISILSSLCYQYAEALSTLGTKSLWPPHISAIPLLTTGLHLIANLYLQHLLYKTKSVYLVFPSFLVFDSVSFPSQGLTRIFCC